MKQRVLIALLTILVLGAGYLAGVWTERHSCKVPKPPALLGELAPEKRKVTSAPATPPANAAELAAEIERLRPEIDQFRERMDQIDREMDRDIMAILRPDQKPVFEKMIKYYADLRNKEDTELKVPQPLTAEEINRLKQKPLYKMLSIVVVPMRVQWNVRDLKLDDTQREQLRKILVERRQKFLDLVDSSPPPSLTLSQLASVAQRLHTEKK